MPFNFSTDIPPTQALIIMAAALLALTLAIVATWLMLSRISRHHKQCASSAPDPSTPMPSVSVIVFSQDNATGLETLLPAILNQQYNGRIEVVVVNDGESASVRRVITTLQLEHPNVYLTHTPDGARNLSRKKLAITLGIKAARNEIVLLTHACCTLPLNGGNTWLMRMMSHFSQPDTGLVLGYANAPFAEMPKSSRTLAFDYAADNATWLTAAIAGHTYMGTSCNIAYRRHLFFDNKGFSRSLQLNNGDDDIFVSEIASSTITAVEIAPETVVTTNFRNPADTIENDRIGHTFTSRYVSRRWRRYMALATWFIYAALACSIALAALWPTNIPCLCAAAAIIIATLVWPAIYWSSTVRILTGKRLRLTLPWLMLTRPLRLTMLKLKAARHNNKNFTWN